MAIAAWLAIPTTRRSARSVKTPGWGWPKKSPPRTSPPPNQQGVTGEGDHALALRPAGVADAGIAADSVRQVGLPFLGDQADLELANRHAPVGTVEVRVEARAGLQLQHLLDFH